MSRTPDVRRIAEALRYPGIDPSTWVTAGRVELDGLHWDSGVGWIIDVVPYGGGLEGGDGIPVRVLSTGPGGSGFGEYIPPSENAEVLLALGGGDPEQNPVLVGYLTNEDDGHAPSTVNGLPVQADLSASGATAVSPFDTEIKRSPFHRREEYAGDRQVQAKNQILEAAELVKLAVRDAAQSYVRGERFVQALNGWIDAVTSFVTFNGEADLLVYAAVNILAPLSIPPDKIQAVATAIAQTEAQRVGFQSAAVEGDALSARIKGD